MRRFQNLAVRRIRQDTMNRSTRNALAAINRRFYAHVAVDFDASRARPWPGWEPLLEHAPRPRDIPRVLDIGCGNGRFATWLAERLGRDSLEGGPLDYLGIDADADLLRAADRRLQELDGRHALHAVDLVDDEALSLSSLLEGHSFDWIVAFAVLHHIPGEASRLALVRRLAEHLAPGGLLALSYWLFNSRSTWLDKTVPWNAFSPVGGDAAALDLADLEDGDYLLSWDGRPDPPRYCHLPSDAEIDRLAGGLDLPTVARYKADGRDQASNLYLVFRRPPFSEPGLPPSAPDC